MTWKSKQKLKYLQKEQSLLDEIKGIFIFFKRFLFRWKLSQTWAAALNMLELPVVGLNIANWDNLNFKRVELRQWLSLEGMT